MTTFVDTSAWYALVAVEDTGHGPALAWLEGTASAEEPERLRTHAYVIVETIALAQARLGSAAVRTLIEDVLPAAEIRYPDAELHGNAVSAYLGGLGRRASLVDRTSFAMMRDERIDVAFTLDRDFRREGFTTVP